MMSELQRGPRESLMQLKAKAENLAGRRTTESAAGMDAGRTSEGVHIVGP